MILTITPPEETALQAHLHKLRTQLHEDPELSWQEHRTTRLVRRELEALCLEPVPLGLPTGTAALLRGALPGPTVGLRADLDALPNTETAACSIAAASPASLHRAGVPSVQPTAAVQPHAAAIPAVRASSRAFAWARVRAENVRIVPSRVQRSGMTLLQVPA